MLVFSSFSFFFICKHHRQASSSPLLHSSTPYCSIHQRPFREFGNLASRRIPASNAKPLSAPHRKKRIDKHTLDKANTTFQHRSSNLARLFQALCIRLLENRYIVQSKGYSPHGCLFVAKRDRNPRILNHPSPDYPAHYKGNRV